MDNKNEKDKSREYYLFAFRIIGDFGASIAVPVVLLAMLGQYLDEKYGTTPWLTALGFALAAYITYRLIRRKATDYGEQYKKLNEKWDKPTKKE